MYYEHLTEKAYFYPDKREAEAQFQLQGLQF